MEELKLTTDTWAIITNLKNNRVKARNYNFSNNFIAVLNDSFIMHRNESICCISTYDELWLIPRNSVSSITNIMYVLEMNKKIASLSDLTGFFEGLIPRPTSETQTGLSLHCFQEM